MAERYDVHVLLLAQINRTVAKQSDKRPSREDVKGSGGWEEVADQIFAVHREKVYDPDDDEDLFEVGLLKQKLGPFGTWYSYEWTAKFLRIGKFVESSSA